MSRMKPVVTSVEEFFAKADAQATEWETMITSVLEEGQRRRAVYDEAVAKRTRIAYALPPRAEVLARGMAFIDDAATRWRAAHAGVVCRQLAGRDGEAILQALQEPNAEHRAAQLSACAQPKRPRWPVGFEGASSLGAWMAACPNAAKAELAAWVAAVPEAGISDAEYVAQCRAADERVTDAEVKHTEWVERGRRMGLAEDKLPYLPAVEERMRQAHAAAALAEKQATARAATEKWKQEQQAGSGRPKIQFATMYPGRDRG